jgi:hypothetical protein
MTISPVVRNVQIEQYVTKAQMHHFEFNARIGRSELAPDVDIDGVSGNRACCSQEEIDRLSEVLQLCFIGLSTADICHQALVSSDSDLPLYCQGIRQLRHLCRATKLVPTPCIISKEIAQIPTNPISKTAFSDVWSGTLDGSPVAIKVLRLHRDDLEKMGKVSLLFFVTLCDPR